MLCSDLRGMWQSTTAQKNLHKRRSLCAAILYKAYVEIGIISLFMSLFIKDGATKKSEASPTWHLAALVYTL